MKKRKNKIALEWITRAESDYQYACAGDKATQIHQVTCYLCHQATEKALKSLLISAGEEPPKTHHLGFLTTKVIAAFPSFQKLFREIRKLDKFYVSARYPDDTFDEYRKEDADFALETTQKVLDLSHKQF